MVRDNILDIIKGHIGSTTAYRQQTQLRGIKVSKTTNPAAGTPFSMVCVDGCRDSMGCTEEFDFTTGQLPTGVEAVGEGVELKPGRGGETYLVMRKGTYLRRLGGRHGLICELGENGFSKQIDL